MLKQWRQRLASTVGLRLAVWYAGVFLLTAVVTGLLSYQLLLTSLERRDHDLLLVKLAEYADRYERGGLNAVAESVMSERTSGSQDSVMVRLVGGGADVRYFVLPFDLRPYDLGPLNAVQPSAGDDWREVHSRVDTTRLEVVSRPLWDGTILQVGRTTVERDQFLAQVRDLIGILIVCVVVAGLAGGVALTRTALRPLRDLRDTVRGITATGRLDARVAAGSQGDLVDELGVVFNAMFARIEALVGGMRDALDNVAHDLRTPIARLRARAESALASGEDPATVREALATCVEEADRVMALLATLMDISEAEARTMRLTLAPVPVDEIIGDTIDLYEDTADDRGVTLTALPTPPGLAVQADRQRLRQVLANLVDNAVKFTPAGGQVTIGAEGTTGGVTLAVRDTGRGIPPEDLPRIWDRLYRGDAGQAQGLGLGLSLVRAIVTAHGGRAEVESEVGKGSTFRVTLPAATVAGASAASRV
jgi:signal transduction histidine kinase